MSLHNSPACSSCVCPILRTRCPSLTDPLPPQVSVSGIPASWSAKQRAEVRPKVVWESVTGRGRRTVGSPPSFSASLLSSPPAKLTVVDLVAVQQQKGASGGGHSGARWLSLLRIEPGEYSESLGAFQCRAENAYGHHASPLVKVDVYGEDCADRGSCSRRFPSIHSYYRRLL